MKRHKHRKYKDRSWLYEQLILQKQTIKTIAEYCSVSDSTIEKWAQRFGLLDDAAMQLQQKRTEIKKQHKQEIRQKAYEYLGGECAICGYNKCWQALEFHHINPVEKKYKIADGFKRGWQSLKKELNKCMLLCRNCHAEVHAGLIVTKVGDKNAT